MRGAKLFEFDNKYFEAEGGLIIGNTVSPLFAEIFMDNSEKKIEKYPMFKNIIFWYRYVDDVFVAFKGTERQLYTLILNLH